jgi:hypothetical protein
MILFTAVALLTFIYEEGANWVTYTLGGLLSVLIILVILSEISKTNRKDK